MSKELEQLRKELNERIDAVINKSDKTTEFEKGWHKFKAPDSPTVYLVLNPSIDGNTLNADFIINLNHGDSYQKQPLTHSAKAYTCLGNATPSEIQEALTKEAVKKGFKKDIGIMSFYDNLTPYCKQYEIGSMTLEYSEKEDELYTSDNHLRLYCKGKWAEIVTPKEEPIMIGTYEVVIHPRAKEISINGRQYHKDTLETIKKVLELPHVHSFNVGCNGQYKVDLDLINKILSRF